MFTKYNASNIVVAQADMLKAASAIRSSIDKEIATAFSGHIHTFDGVTVIVFSSGYCRLAGDGDLPSAEVAAERAKLQAAYDYHRDVRKAARSIAPTLLPQQMYIRDGNRFRKFSSND